MCESKARIYKRAIASQLKDQVAGQNQQFDERFKEIDEKLTASYEAADAKLNFQGSGVRYHLALLAWKSSDPRSAIYQANMALEHADDAIKVFESLNRLRPNDAKDLKPNLEYRCFIVGDLAYYYAEAYKAKPQIDDGYNALKFARRLHNEWTVFPTPPITLVDSYLFVLATVREITDDEHSIARALWRDWRVLLVEFLEDYDAAVAKEHVELFGQFFGPI